MRAIEKFDCARGNRLSTYATWAIMRHFARAVPAEGKQAATYVTGTEELIDAAQDDGGFDREAARRDILHAMRHAIGGAFDQLTDRQREVVAARFGLDGDGTPKTLREIGRELGLSRERVRQIQVEALDKIRSVVDIQAFEAYLE